jgi:creatine kinase
VLAAPADKRACLPAQTGSHEEGGWKQGTAVTKADASTTADLEAMLASTGAEAPGYLPKTKDAPDMSFPSIDCPSELPDLSQHTSLLAGVLKDDPALYDTYKNVATGSGVTFATCIKPGLENMATQVGLVAGSEDCFSAFSGVFDAVIAARHSGYAADAVHKTDLDAAGISDVVVDSSGKYVVSTRIRSGRNISGFCLAPSIDGDSRLQVESVVTAALGGMTGDLAGEYSGLEGISAAKEDELRAAGVLFEEPTSAVLVSAGIHADWPSGRGVFCNGGKTFLVWVNEEDHARIVSMDTGGDIKAVFTRYFAGVTALQSGLQSQGMGFMYSDHLGHMSYSPSNLGTALKATVMMKIPALGKHPDFQATLAELGLTGVGAGGLFEISTKDVLGKTEVELANLLIAGVVSIIGKEMALEQGLPLELSAMMAVKANYPDNICAAVFDPEYYMSLSEDDQKAFLLCLNSGIENPDSGMGCYACQPEDYDKFKPFFSKALAKYHKVAEDAKHVNDWSLEGVEGLPEGGVLDIAALGLPELSMRVRVGRNLKAFPLPGAMTQEDRCNMENFMLKAFEVLFGMSEYGGKYCSFTPGHPNFVDESEYQALVDAHIAFKDMSADQYLLSAGIAQHWPYGRGVYISEDKGFIIWVGEEDHLRIMCMKKGTVLNEVFDRLKAALDVVNGIEGLEFAVSEDYGVVTSCPTNLGTGMRASLHIALPNLTADGTDKKAKAIAKPLGLSVRGLGGEHTPIGADGTVDISPSARFCIKEAEIIAALYKGIALLKEAEDAAAAAPAQVYIVQGTPEAEACDLDFDLVMNPSLAKNEYPVEQLETQRAAEHTSLCAQFATPEIWEQYKDKVSSGPAKWTLARAINTGVMYPSSFVGCHAGDSSSYDDFKDFFYPVIQAYHKGFDIETTKHVTDMDPTKISTSLSEAAQSKIISTRIRVARNLSMFPLNPGADKDTRGQICDMMEKVYAAIDPESDLSGDMFRHTTMSDEQRQGLIDDHFLFRGKDKMQAASGYHQYWPEGRGVFHNKAKTFVNWLNEGDHLRIISMEQGGDVLGVFTRLAEGAKMIKAGVEAETGEEEAFMMHPIFGSLTCCPSNIGTGMRGSVHILVPKLIKTIGFDAIDKMCRERNCQARGSSGEHSEVVDRIDVSNWRRIGFPEYELVHDMIKCANFLAEEEDKVPDDA